MKWHIKEVKEKKKVVFMLLSIQCLTEKPIFLIIQCRKTGYPGAEALTEVSRTKPHGVTGENLANKPGFKSLLMLSLPDPMVGARRNRD